MKGVKDIDFTDSAENINKTILGEAYDPRYKNILRLIYDAIWRTWFVWFWINRSFNWCKTQHMVISTSVKSI